MEHNLSFFEITMRYAMILAVGILFGLTQWIVLIPVAIAIFITAVSGWCPLYQALGINHCGDQEHF